jgi:hypothetical protein
VAWSAIDFRLAIDGGKGAHLSSLSANISGAATKPVPAAMVPLRKKVRRENIQASLRKAPL